MQNGKIACVLGATGGVGGAITEALLARGWRINALVRDVEKAQKIFAEDVNWVQGDAMIRHDVIKAATNASVIIHALNPPGYRNWSKLVLPMIDNTIFAAEQIGARIVLPGTIYNYDPAKTRLVNAETPQNAKSRKGKIRVELEKRLERASANSPVLILRAGDFYGSDLRSSWFSQAMIKAGKPVTKITMTARGAGHSWAYLPDLAECFSRLIEIPEKLKDFEVLQFEGLYEQTGHEMADSIERILGRKIKRATFPWWAMQLLAPLGGFPREAAEIAPYWKYPMKLDNTRLIQLLGEEIHTPLDATIYSSLIDMKCLSS